MVSTFQNYCSLDELNDIQYYLFKTTHYKIHDISHFIKRKSYSDAYQLDSERNTFEDVWNKTLCKDIKNMVSYFKHCSVNFIIIYIITQNKHLHGT